MKFLYRFALALVCLFGLGQVASAQSTTVTASQIKISGFLIPTGLVTFAPVDINGAPISFADGTGAQNGPKAIACQIVNGAITGALTESGSVSGSCVVPDSSLTTPQNIMYQIQVTDQSTGLRTSGISYTLHTVVGVSGSTWALDHYGPPAQTTNVSPLESSVGTVLPSPCVVPSVFTLMASGVLSGFYTCVGGTEVLITNGTGSGSVGPMGPTGPTGATGAAGSNGAAGPNIVTTSTSTTITGLLKGNGSNVGLAVAGTDYMLPTSNITGTAAGLSAASALPNGTTVTTQSTSDTSGQAASDEFVAAAITASGGAAPGAYLQTGASGSQTMVIPAAGGLFETETNNTLASMVMHKLTLLNVGQGYDLGSPWSTHNTLTLNELNTVRGNNQMIPITFNNWAVGDADGLYIAMLNFGGKKFASDEGVNTQTLQMHQAPEIYGPLATPQAGNLFGAFGALVAGNTFISIGAVFPVTGQVQTVSIPFPSGSTAQTAYVGVGTLGTANSITITQVVPISIPTTVGNNTQVYTAGSTLPTLLASGGQVLLYFQATGEGPSGTSVSPNCLPASGVPTVGTYTMSTTNAACNIGGYYGGLVIEATQAAPTVGATTIWINPVSYYGYLDYNLSPPMFSDDQIVYDTASVATGTIGSQSTLEGLATGFTLSSGTVPVSTAFGFLSACSGSGNGQTQVAALVTCTVTPSTSPASGAFVAPITLTGSTTSGSTTVPVSSTTGMIVGQMLIGTGIPAWDTIASIGSGSVVMTTAATATNSTEAMHIRTTVAISGYFGETAAMSTVTALSGGTQTIAFYSTYPPVAHDGEFIGQGGMAGTGMTIANTGWAPMWQIIASISSTQFILSNCVTGGCFTTGYLPAATNSAYFYPMSYVNGTNGGISGSANLLANDMPDNPGDGIEGAPSTEYSGNITFEVFGQNTPIDYSQPSGMHYMLHDGPIGPAYEWDIQENGSLFTNTMMLNGVHYGSVFSFSHYPTTCFACWSSQSSGAVFTLFGVYNVGNFSVDYSGFHFNTPLSSNNIVFSAAAPTTTTGQVGFGSTVVASSFCGSLSGAIGCTVINVAGTAHYQPYW